MMRMIHFGLVFAAAAVFGASDDTNQTANVTAIHEFAAAGDLEDLKALLDRYPELIDRRQQFPQPRKPSSTDGYTALMRAVRGGKDKVVELLIERGADVNAADGMGWTPLHVAAQQGYLLIVKLLVKNEAKVGSRTVKITHWAVPSGSADEPPMIIDIPSLSPLDLAVAAKHSEVVSFLESVSEK